MSLLRAIGEHGQLISYEIRQDHLDYAEDNVTEFFGGHPKNWSLRLGDLRDVHLDDLDGMPVDRIILDMLEPWECLDTVRELLLPGGVFMTYVATVDEGDGGDSSTEMLYGAAGVGIVGAGVEGGWFGHPPGAPDECAYGVFGVGA